MACVVMTVCLYAFAPRERMDAPGPPVTSPSQQRRSGNTWSSRENLIRGTVTLVFAFFLLHVSQSQEDTNTKNIGRFLVSPLTKMLSFQQRRLSAGVLACETVSN